MEKKSLIIPLLLVLAGAIIGLVFAGALIYEHNGAKTQIGSTVCEAGETSSCDKAKQSAVGRIFGLPLALYGYIFYGGIAALACFLWLSLNETATSLLFWGAIAALAFDIFLLLYSIFVLGGVCRLCAITYIGSLLIAIGAYLFKKRSESMIKPESSSLAAKGSFSAILLLTVVSGLFFHLNAQANQTPQAEGKTPEERRLREQLNEEFYRQWKTGEALGLDKPQTGMKGAANPVLTIIEFADPLCPHCKAMSVVLGEFVKKYPDKVRLIFRHYPLDIECNSAMKRAFHVGACDLARAMECAEAQGKFWAMHDAIFAQQDVFLRNPVTEQAIESLAKAADANAAQLTACFRQKITMAKVKADISAGNRIKVTGTPTVIVNDRRLPGVPLEFVPGILEKILLEESKR
jgi:protein-disulfide isomerase/uncharacterized membrane protein